MIVLEARVIIYLDDLEDSELQHATTNIKQSIYQAMVPYKASLSIKRQEDTKEKESNNGSF
jgi:hypothetical protein